MEVAANDEECFFDKVKAGTKLGLTFEVAEGGFLDIDVRIVGPDSKPIHQVGTREGEVSGTDIVSKEVERAKVRETYTLTSKLVKNAIMGYYEQIFGRIS